MSEKKRSRVRPQQLVGKVIVGMYPRHNFQGVPSYCERRQVLVEKVRVLRREPLDSLTSTINPLLNRGATLITGTDLDKDEERSFYLESFRVWESFDYEPEIASNPGEPADVKSAAQKPLRSKQALRNSEPGIRGPANGNAANGNPANGNALNGGPASNRGRAIRSRAAVGPASRNPPGRNPSGREPSGSNPSHRNLSHRNPLRRRGA